MSQALSGEVISPDLYESQLFNTSVVQCFSFPSLDVWRVNFWMLLVLIFEDYVNELQYRNLNRFMCFVVVEDWRPTPISAILQSESATIGKTLCYLVCQ